MNPHSDDQISRISSSLLSKKIITPSFISKILQTALWSLCYFIFYFIQQIAELVAPFLFIAGILWKIIPIAINSLSHTTVSLDQQAREIINNATSAIPSQIIVAGHTLTPDGLISDGIMLMLLAAAGATLTALAGKNI